MAYSNYRSDWSRDRDERGRSQRDWDEDDSRRARESMERDYYGSEMGGRGGYGGSRGEPGGRSHYGNETGGWQGREEEQWRNRDVHGPYDREANYGGFSSSGTGNYRGYGGSGGSYRGGQGRWGEAGTQYSQGGSQGDYNYRGYERGRSGYQSGGGEGQRYGQGYGQGGRGRGLGQSHGIGSGERPSGGRAYGDYSGSPSGYFGDEYGSRGQGLDQWGSSEEYGAHRGRGPRGYKRSDDRIKEDVCDCLTDDDRLDASNIEVGVKDGEVTLSGYVTSREDKRWAESLVERISGVKEVQNSIRVQDQQRSQTGTQSSTQGAGATSRAGDKSRESNIQH